MKLIFWNTLQINIDIMRLNYVWTGLEYTCSIGLQAYHPSIPTSGLYTLQSCFIQGNPYKVRHYFESFIIIMRESNFECKNDEIGWKLLKSVSLRMNIPIFFWKGVDYLSQTVIFWSLYPCFTWWCKPLIFHTLTIWSMKGEGPWVMNST